MLKRTLLIFTALILCGTVGSARNIDAAAYAKLVDFCNCKYAEAYLDDFYNKNPEKKKVYETGIKAKLSGSTVDKPLSFETLSDLVKDTPAKDLVKNYKENRKSNNSLSIEKLYIPSYGVNFKVDFTKLNVSLKKIINQYLEGKTNTTNTTTSTNVNTNTEINTNPNTNTNTNDINNSPEANNEVSVNSVINLEDEGPGLWYYFRWILLLMVLFLAFWYSKQLKSFIAWIIPGKKKEKINADDEYRQEAEPNPETIEAAPKEPKKIALEPKDLVRVFNWILSNPSAGRQFGEYILQDEQLCSLWVKSVLKYPKITELLKNELLQKTPESPAIAMPEEKQINRTKPAQPQSSSSTILYSDSIIDEYFNRLRETPNENTVFELRLQNPQTASFTVYPAAYKRIIANPSILEGCEKQVSTGAQNLHIEREGAVRRQPDGKWKIIKKLYVIIK